MWKSREINRSDTRDVSETIEYSLTWCYGIDVDAIEKLIEETKKRR